MSAEITIKLVGEYKISKGIDWNAPLCNVVITFENGTKIEGVVAGGVVIEGVVTEKGYSSEIKALSDYLFNPPDLEKGYSSSEIEGALQSLNPNILSLMVQGCPDKFCQDLPSSPLMETIIHLNDHHKWSREKIADFLDSLPYDLTLQKTGG